MSDAPHELRTFEAWRDTHQVFELNWWKKALREGHSGDDAGFAAHWALVGEFVKPEGRIIDIGCGPRPPFAPCVAIEPLGNEYREITPRHWWDGVRLISEPAESLVPDIAGDTVICWNCIDHAHGWRGILDNMATYARRAGPAARVAIATDFHPPFTGHPGFERDDFMAEIVARFNIVDTREPFGRAWAAIMKVKG